MEREQGAGAIKRPDVRVLVRVLVPGRNVSNG
jgi:hypothetical protein